MRLATLDTPTSSGGIATGFRGVFIMGLDGDRVVGMARERDDLHRLAPLRRALDVS